MMLTNHAYSGNMTERFFVMNEKNKALLLKVAGAMTIGIIVGLVAIAVLQLFSLHA